MPRKVNPGTLRVGPGLAHPNSVDSNSLISPTGGSTGLLAHIDDPVDAHDASSISIDGVPSTYDASDVDGALDELSALVPPRPPFLGSYSNLVGFTSIPDWGVLKLSDAGLVARTLLTSSNDVSVIYPYFHDLPETADDDPPFTVVGNDPQTDPTFNVPDGTYTGGGLGITFQGGFTRSGSVVQTNRTLRPPGSGDRSVVVSGSIYPADRGVLALLYFPPPGTLTAFDAQADADKCIGALLLGQGIESGCDGLPGGIFSLGTPSGGSFDPFGFPGRASGQFNLVELHTGVSSTGGVTPPPADADAGRVRLGYDILGATTNAAAPTLGVDNRNDNNFLRYRLPYMADYSDSSGIRYTPEVEKSRYYEKPAISLDPGTDLTQAGDYLIFEKDYWTFQIGRFRHRFLFPTLPAGFRDVGSFVLLHFKTEKAFEALVVDGASPSDDDLYSVNMVDWSGVESTANLTSGLPGLTASSSYHILRGAIAEDPDGDAALTFSGGNTWDYIRTIDTTQQVSGIHYFIPASGGTPWSITTLTADASDVWKNTYRTGSGASSSGITPGLEGPNPSHLFLGAFAAGSTLSVPGSFGTVASQRVEFDYTQLDATSGHGAFDLTNGPLAGDDASITLVGFGSLDPLGDVSNPRMLGDAKIRWFFRRPVGHEFVADTTQGAVIPVADGKTILFHTTRISSPEFANPVGAGVALAGTETSSKDSYEQFLDEVYRYDSTFPSLPAIDRTQLIGPGLPNAPTPIFTPPRIGSATPPYLGVSWIQNGLHVGSLPAGEAQVGGFPDRDPPLSDGVATPYPSNGVLLYPQKDYSTGYRPSLADGDLSNPQNDYSSLTGDRSYIRVLDVAFINSGTPVPAAGTSLFTLRIKGLKLEDFAYLAPGPGGLGLAILVKVPGLTTWMDIGRADGSGPGKQDAFADGSGCQVVGPLTFDDVDSVTGIVQCQVQVHVGPTVTLFANPDGAVPIMVKAIIKDNATGKGFNLEQGGASGSSGDIRGIIGMEIVRPS